MDVFFCIYYDPDGGQTGIIQMTVEQIRMYGIFGDVLLLLIFIFRKREKIMPGVFTGFIQNNHIVHFLYCKLPW